MSDQTGQYSVAVTLAPDEVALLERAADRMRVAQQMLLQHCISIALNAEFSRLRAAEEAAEQILPSRY